MRVLLTGGSGQLGRALIATQPTRLGGEPLELLAPSRSELDLADPQACHAAVRFHRPDWVLNAGAYTAVDRAEQEPELAAAVNGAAPEAMATALRDGPGRMLQLSTDFVFDGAQGSPYRPDAATAPLGVYGLTKAHGEQAVLGPLGPQGRAHVLRTGWVYGPVGQNFCLTMLRLHRQRALQGQPLAVVADQVGCPTSTAGLAAACWRLLQRATVAALAGEPPLPPILHWSDAGAASWYDFAVAIGEQATALGLLERAAQVLPITTAEYPTPAQRPSYSLLDGTATRAALDLQPSHWRLALEAVLRQRLLAEPWEPPGTQP
jgi:dTDP-4-dehydrorhamnose reductase